MHVTDSNPWPSSALSELQGQGNPTGESVPPAPLGLDLRRVGQPTIAPSDESQAGLSLLLGEHFDLAHDRILWSWSEAERAVREVADGAVKPEHDGPPPPHLASLARRTNWLVVVPAIGESLAPVRAAQLAATLADNQCLLVVARRDHHERQQLGDSDGRNGELPAINTNGHGLLEVGPLESQDAGAFLGAVRRIKQENRSAILWLQVDAPAVTAPAELSALEARNVAERVAEAPSWAQIASESLAELALHDTRIMALSTALDRSIVKPWETLGERFLAVDANVADALTWCASLALSGARPAAFLTWDELHDSLGHIRREICRSQAPVTLIVDSRDAAGSEWASSAALGGVRQLPNVTLLAPRSGDELRQLVAWSTRHEGPVVLWLPPVKVPDDLGVSANASVPVELGLGESLRTGSDVAIVAWGPMTAAALAAADVLAQQGVRASVFSARFAQPLDIDGIVAAVGAAQCAVLIDDELHSGGFGCWVLELLLERGLTQCVTIVRPAGEAPTGASGAMLARVTRDVVQRCLWLAAPMMADVPVESTVTVRGHAEVVVSPHHWLNLAGIQPGGLAREHQQVLSQQLSTDALRWVKMYEEIGSRDLYLWRWCRHGVDLTTLPCALPELRAHVCDTKLLSIVLCVLLDDVADQHGDSRLLDALLETTPSAPEISWRNLSVAERKHAEVTQSLWAEYWSRQESYPAHARFAPVLRYDLTQFFNTMRYSHLVNSQPYLLNMVEHDLYTSHNMMMISFATLDLMCSQSFPLAEVGMLRQAMWHAQCMGRVGNLLSTWQRELRDRDFTSGVFARAVMEGDLTLEELEHGDTAQLERRIRSAGHESYFYRKWLDHRASFHTYAQRLESLPMHKVMEGHDRFFAMHLGSQGLI